MDKDRKKKSLKDDAKESPPDNGGRSGSDEKLSIEESFKELGGILERMESEDTGLEETFRLYERGLKLVKNAESSIDRIEKQIKILDDEL